MSKNYAPRSQTAEKVNYSKFEAPGFNVENVILDEETKSPRLLSSYYKQGMRKLDSYEKKLYYEHIKPKEEKEKQEKNIAKVNPNVNVNLDKFKQEGKNQLRKNYRIGFDEYPNGRDKFLMMNKKRVLEDNSYGIQHYKKDKEQVKEQVKMNDSMTQSTTRLVEKVLMEQKSPQSNSDRCKCQLLAAEVASLSQLLKKRDEQNRQTSQMIRKMWEMMNSSSNMKIDNTDNQLLRLQLRQAQQKANIAEGEKAILLKQLDNNRRIYDSMTLKYKDSQIAAKELRANYEKLTVAFKQKQDELRKSESLNEYYKQKIQEQSNKKTQNQAKKVIFYSQTAIENDLENFLKTQIQKFTGKIIHRARLLYQKDEWNTNITNYIQKTSSPFLFLFKTAKGNIFGAFTEGIQTMKSKRQKEEGYRIFRAFLFNATAGTVFLGQENPKHVCGVSYYDNYLRFGNNQLGFKNHNLGIMNFPGSSVFGEKFYNVPRRHHLTGEQGEIVEISTFQILQVFLL